MGIRTSDWSQMDRWKTKRSAVQVVIYATSGLIISGELPWIEEKSGRTHL